MKRIRLLLTGMALAVGMLLVFCGCSSYSGILSAYEREGYREYAMTDVIKEAFKISDEDAEDAKAAVHFLTTAEIEKDDDLIALTAKVLASKSVIVWEYTDVDALKAAFEETLGEKEKEEFDKRWAEYQKLPTVSGNCVLVWGDSEIFRNTK